MDDVQVEQADVFRVLAANRAERIEALEQQVAILTAVVAVKDQQIQQFHDDAEGVKADAP